VLLGAFVVLKSFLLRNILSMSCVNAACSSIIIQKPKRIKNRNKNTRKAKKGLCRRTVVSFSLIKRTRQNQNQNQNHELVRTTRTRHRRGAILYLCGEQELDLAARNTQKEEEEKKASYHLSHRALLAPDTAQAAPLGRILLTATHAHTAGSPIPPAPFHTAL
jgi:hypothetical protein